MKTTAVLLLLLSLAACGGDSTKPTPPARLEFIIEPTDRVVETAFAFDLTAAVEDAQRNRITNSSAPLTITITPGTGTGGGGATLSGTLTRPASSGLATFNDLSIDMPGSGYTLTAASTGLASDTSASFRIFAPFVAASVSAGPYLTTCAVTSDGTPYCWGYNTYGSVGNGSTTETIAPVPLSGGGGGAGGAG